MPQREPSPTAARTSSPVAPITMPTCVMPAAAIASSAWNRIGRARDRDQLLGVRGRDRAQSRTLAPREHERAHQSLGREDTRAARRRRRRRAPARTSRPRRRPRRRAGHLTCFISSVGKYFCDDLCLGVGVGRVGDHAARHLLLVGGGGAHARRDVEPGLREHLLHLGRRASRRMVDHEHGHVGLRRRRVARSRPTSPSGFPSRIAAKMRSADSSMRQDAEVRRVGNGPARCGTPPRRTRCPRAGRRGTTRSARFMSSSRVRFCMIGRIITGQPARSDPAAAAC